MSITQYAENENKSKIDQFLYNHKNQTIFIKIRKFLTKKINYKMLKY